MLTPFLLLASLLLFALPAEFQDSQAPAAGPATAAPATPAPAAQSAKPSESASIPNPVHPTPASQTRAKHIFDMDCAMCHGQDGSGKGDITGTAKMLDYRNASALQGLTDGQIFDIIKDGKGDMPPEGGRAKPDETWNLVIYLRSFAKTQDTASHGPS